MKIEEQVLSIEQMYHLQELGVDTSDASMRWVGNDVVPNSTALDLGYDGIFTYTIGDLIEKLPVSIDGVHGIRYHRKILIKGEYTVVRYMDGSDYCPLFYSRSLFIELLYNLLCEVAKTHKELLEVKK